MKGSIRIAKVAGIPVKIHWSFGLLFLFIIYTGRQDSLSHEQLFWHSIFILIIFVCVILHEYGHALTARRYGIKTIDIVMLPIGGLARLQKMPEKPEQELFIAIGGPMVNFAIALILSPYFFFHSIFDLIKVNPILFFIDPNYLIPALIFMNVFLALFNLLPAFPMDGGRILRALLAFRFTRRTATLIAVRVEAGVFTGFYRICILD